MKRDILHGSVTAPRRTGRVVFAALCATAMLAVVASPVTVDQNGFVTNAVQAAGKGGGNGNGRDGAPGQIKQATDGSAATEDSAIESVTGATADGGSTLDQTIIIPIAEDEASTTNKVIQEIAGIPEESELSEEEELEAIQSGWGTWRTADGPETVIAQ